MAVEYKVKYTPDFDPTIVNVSQNDVGRQFDIKIIDETGAAQQIPSGSTVKFVGMKPSGLGFTVNCTFNGAIVHVTTTDIMTDEYGLIPAEVQITNGSTVIGTANVNMRVEKNPHPEGTIDDNLIRIIPTFNAIYQRLDILESSMSTAQSNISDLQTRMGTVEDQADDAYALASQAADMAHEQGIEIGGIKRGYDGTVYITAGAAVRGQVEDIRAEIDQIANLDLYTTSGATYGQYLDDSGATGTADQAMYTNYIKVSPSELYTFKATTGTPLSFAVRIHEYNSNKTWLKMAAKYQVTTTTPSGSAIGSSFTVSSTTEYVRISIGSVPRVLSPLFVRGEDGVTAIDRSARAELEKLENDLSPIVSFDLYNQNVDNSFVNVDGTVVYAAGASRSDYIKIDNSQTYVLSFDADKTAVSSYTYVNVHSYSENHTWLGITARYYLAHGSATSEPVSIPFQPLTNAEYIIVSVGLKTAVKNASLSSATLGGVTAIDSFARNDIDELADTLNGITGLEAITNVELGSLNTDTGANYDLAVNRFRTGYIPVFKGAVISLTEYGKENGFKFNAFQYTTTSTFADHKAYIGNRGLSADDYVVTDLNCAFVRMTISKGSLSDVTGLDDEFEQALQITPSDAHVYKSSFLFAENLQVFEKFFTNSTNYNQSSVTAAEMLEKYDALVDDNLTVIKTGADNFGNTLKAYAYKPRAKGYYNHHVIASGTFTEFAFPKIMIVGNIHGSERSPSFSLLKLFELLTANEYINDSIEFIKNNVEIISVPLANPSGWNGNTYENGAGVNLNRDFPPYGSSTQPETQFIQSVFNENKNGLNFYFDFHNTWWDELHRWENADNPYNMPILGYVYTDNPLFQQIGCNIYSMFKSRVNSSAATPIDYFVYCESARKGTSAVWAQSQGIEGTLFEIDRLIPNLLNTQWGNDVIIWGVNLVCSFITNSIYTLRLNK